MDNIGEEFNQCYTWSTENMLFPDSWPFDDQTFSGNYDSSSPDGGASSSPASKNIVSERNRRKKLTDRLHALRAVVPNISKMDKASIIKDAIAYIQELHEQEKRIQGEIMELESGKLKNQIDFEEEELPLLLRSKKKRTSDHHQMIFDPAATTSRNYPIEIIELRVIYMREKTFVVSLRCHKKTDTMVKLCEAFESLRLKIITANITSFSGILMKTVFIEADEDEKDILQIKIQTAIAALNDPESPMSI